MHIAEQNASASTARTSMGPSSMTFEDLTVVRTRALSDINDVRALYEVAANGTGPTERRQRLGELSSAILRSTFGSYSARQ